jgi:hypothetical protein
VKLDHVGVVVGFVENARDQSALTGHAQAELATGALYRPGDPPS